MGGHEVAEAASPDDALNTPGRTGLLAVEDYAAAVPASEAMKRSDAISLAREKLGA